MDTISDTGSDQYSLLGLTSNLGFAYYICDICIYEFLSIGKYPTRMSYSRHPRNFNVQCFSKIIIFRLIILTFFSSRKKREQRNYSNAKQKTKGRLRKLTDLTDEGQPKKEQRNHPSTASRVLKEIIQRPNHLREYILMSIYTRVLSNSAHQTLMSHIASARYFKILGLIPQGVRRRNKIKV